MSKDTVISGLRWTDSEGVQEHPLPFRLQGVRPFVRRPSWSLETLSGHIHTEKAVDRAHEIEGLVRFEDAPQALVETLSDRIGEPITYFEQRPGEAEVTYPSLLVAVDGDAGWMVGLDEDPQRAGFGEYAVRLRLRRVDGGTYEGLL